MWQHYCGEQIECYFISLTTHTNSCLEGLFAHLNLPDLRIFWHSSVPMPSSLSGWLGTGGGHFQVPPQMFDSGWNHRVACLILTEGLVCAVGRWTFIPAWGPGSSGTGFGLSPTKSSLPVPAAVSPKHVSVKLLPKKPSIKHKVYPGLMGHCYFITFHNTTWPNVKEKLENILWQTVVCAWWDLLRCHMQICSVQ